MKPKTKEKIFDFLMVLGIIMVILVGAFCIIYYKKFVELECPIPCVINTSYLFTGCG